MLLRLNHDEIVRLGSPEPDEDKRLLAELKNVWPKGYLEASELSAIAGWKWRGGRVKNLVRRNSDEDIAHVTKAAFSSDNERLRIGALLSLEGVNWPMASTILHFAFPNKYPIFDVRVMRELQCNAPYSLTLWNQYSAFCRETSLAANVSMRVLDRALWRKDKERQGGRDRIDC